MNAQNVEILLKDLLRITTRETYKLSEVLARNFNFFNETIIKILKEEYQKPKNDWKVLCGCFSVIWKASQGRPIIGDEIFRNSYPLINKGLLDKRISVRRLASLCVLNIICRIYMERAFHINDDNDKEINEEIKELGKNIKSNVFLKSFTSAFPRRLERRLTCESAGIKADSLVEVSKYLLGS